ncbi:MAG: dTDP-4-dehydrorhamnose reductase [Cyanobacteria bacterium P01_H01_bin.15]
MRQKILLLGCQGQLGRDLEPVLAERGDVIAKSRHDLDLRNFDQLRTEIRHLKPDIIINAAAYTAVDKAESEMALADLVNGQAPGVLATLAKIIDARLVHYSTNYVFDGTQSHPYQENDSTGPVSTYGRSKLAGEVAITQVNPRYLIIRTAWVYSWHSRNFLQTMLHLGQERSQLRVIADQVGTPTWTQDIVRGTLSLLDNPDTSSQIVHLANSGVASWYDFAIAIFEEAKTLGWSFAVDTVQPITTADYPTAAQRPPYSVLSLSRYQRLTGQTPPHWRSSLRSVLRGMRT